MVHTRHFEGFNVDAGGFSVLIFHFEGIRSLILGRVFHFIFAYKILNISLTAGLQNVHPR